MTPLPRTLTVAFVLASGVSTPTLAQTNARTPVEIWTCTDLGGSTEVLVTATVDSGRTSGTIAVAGVTYKAGFEVEGFNRLWIFGRAGKFGLRYAFTIEPNGDAKYYDFGRDGPDEPVMPSNYLKCLHAA